MLLIRIPERQPVVRPSVLRTEYSCIEEFHRNGTSVLFSAVERYAPHRRVVIKICANGHREMFLTKFVGENQLPHQLQMYDNWTTEQGLSVLVLERGSCDVLMFVQRYGTLMLPLALQMVYQVAQTLQSLVKIGFSHCDVSLENIVVCGQEFKLVDFGLAQPMWTTTSYTTVGKQDYMAPEIKHPSLQRAHYDLQKADVFSLGVCLHSVLYGDVPTAPYPLPDPLAVNINHLLSNMLRYDHESRFSLNAVLEFLTKVFHLH